MNIDALSASLSDRYRLERELGQGGMATVYLAEDLKHKRKVALKVLKPELAAVLGAERFVVEIKTTAALQHPHILPLFDSGEAGGFLYYVMPFIDGETLRGKLDRETQLGIEESVRIASDVASALHYAHEHGVIHRDIKPENILLHDGRPMVADFGIALAVSAAAGGRMTETGLSLGTPHYMSPEQATAEKEISARSDVYSLGSVLYEMLTGEPPHMGNSAQQIIMKIIAEDAQPVTRLRKAVPRNVAAAVAKSLEKLPADRFETARAFAEALANPGFVGAAGTTARAGAGRAGNRRAQIIWPVITLLVALAGVWGSTRPRPAPDQPVAVFPVLPSDGGTVEVENGRGLTISRDGSVIVFSGRAEGADSASRMLFLRRIGEPETRPIPGTRGGRQPFLSPDGVWVGFFRNDSILRVPVAGGPMETIATTGNFPNNGHWAEDGTVVFGQAGRVYTVPAVGGTITRVPIPDSINIHRPELVAGGRYILGNSRTVEEMDLVVVDRASGEVTILLEDGSAPHYLASGHLVFGRGTGGVFAVPFDLERLAITGPVVAMVSNALVFSGGAMQFDVAENGTAVYLSGVDEQSGELVLVGADGGERVVGPRGRLANPRFSPDGKYVAVSHQSGDATNVQVVDVATGIPSRRTFTSEALVPAWSRDGQSLTYWDRRPSTGSPGIYQVPSDGSGSPKLLVADSTLIPSDWTTDGLLLASRVGPRGWIRELLVVSFTGDSALLTTYLQASREFGVSTLSRDGKWVAYVSRGESGVSEVEIGSFPIPGGRFQISSGGGLAPRWSVDGTTLYYLRPDGSMVAATLRLDAAVTVMEQRDVPGGPRVSRTGYDVHPDGKQFVTLRDQARSRPEMIVVMNWFTTLRERFESVR